MKKSPLLISCLFLWLCWYWEPSVFPYFFEPNPPNLPTESRQTLRGLIQIYLSYQFYAFSMQYPPETLDRLMESAFFPVEQNRWKNPFHQREPITLFNARLVEEKRSLGDFALLTFPPTTREAGIWFQTVIQEGSESKSVLLYLPESIVHSLTERIYPKSLVQDLPKILALPQLEQNLFWKCEMLSFLWQFSGKNEIQAWWLPDFGQQAEQVKKDTKGKQKRKKERIPGSEILLTSAGVQCRDARGNRIYPFGGEEDEKSSDEVSEKSAANDKKSAGALP